MIIYMATGWRYQDGGTRSFLFDNLADRDHFIQKAPEWSNWEYQWHSSEKILGDTDHEIDDFT